MARGKSILWGAMGLGVLAVGGIVWFVMGPGPGASTGPGGEDGTAAGAPAAPPASRAEDPVRRRTGAVVGRLVRGEPAAPIPGAVEVEGPAVPKRAVEVGGNGLFRLEGIPVGAVFGLTATSPGLTPAVFPDLSMPLDGLLDMEDIPLGLMARVEVEVRDLSGRPVAGARADLLRVAPRPDEYDWFARMTEEEPPPRAQETRTTGPEGNAAFETVPPGNWIVRVEAKGFAPESLNFTVVEGEAREPIRVLLGPAATLTGTVTRRGGPAPGVQVFARMMNWWSLGTLGSVASRSDAQGRYRLEGLPKGRVDLGVRLPSGAILGVADLIVPEVSVYDFALEEGATVRGKVLDDATGEGVPGATVIASVWRQDGRSSQANFARTETGEDGTFLLADLPPGTFNSLTVRKEGYVRYPDMQTAQLNEPLGAGDESRQEVRLRRGATLKGRVLTAEGKPVPGAKVRVHMWNPMRGQVLNPTGRTEEDGSFAVSGLSSGRGLVQVTAEGHYAPGYPEQNYWEALQRNRAASPEEEAWFVDLPAEGVLERDFTLKTGGVVEGTVKDASGRPAAGLRVSAFDRKGRGGGGGGPPTGEDGAFRLSGVRPGEEIVVNASGPGGLGGSSEPVRLEDGGKVEGVLVTVEAGAVLEGFLRREDGGPLAGATLRVLQGKLDDSQPWQRAWQLRSAKAQPVGEGGAFRIEGLGSGTHTFLACADGCGETRGPVVTVARGETRSGIEVILRPEQPVAGRVVDENGSPVPGAGIAVSEVVQNQSYGWGGSQDPLVGRSDAEGSFAIHGLGPGKYRVSARMDGKVDATDTVTAPATDVVLTVKPGLAISGVITAAATGEPAARVLVSAQPSKPSPTVSWRSWQARTGEDGSFTLRDLPPGSYTVNIAQVWGTMESDFVPKSVPNVEAGTSDLRESVETGLPIAGRILDGEGNPVLEMVSLQLARETAPAAPGTNPVWNPANNRWAQGKGDGTFRVGGLSPGTWALTVSPQGGGPRRTGSFSATTVRGIAAGTTDVVVRVSEGLPISGKVVDEQGTPPKGRGYVMVQLAGGGNVQNSWVQVQEDGSFTSPPVDPGQTYDLVAMNFPGYAGGKAERVAAGSTGITVVLERGVTITGRLVDEGGGAVPAGVPVTAVAEGAQGNVPGRYGNAATQEDGTFVVAGLADYAYRISAGGGNSEFMPATHPEPVKAGTTGLEIPVRRGVTLSGRLLDAGGSAVANQYVMAKQEGVPQQTWARTEGDGSFALKGLRPGKVSLSTRRGRDTIELGEFTAPDANLEIRVTE